MNTPQIISSNDACILAVEALDSMVTNLVKACYPTPIPDFLDWIADEATDLVETSVSNSFDNPRFINSLQMGHPRIAMAHWVRHWVGPCIVFRYPAMAIHFPEFPHVAFTRDSPAACGMGDSLNPTDVPLRGVVLARHPGNLAAHF